jgi:hypothetical protein
VDRDVNVNVVAGAEWSPEGKNLDVMARLAKLMAEHLDVEISASDEGGRVAIGHLKDPHRADYLIL